MPSGKKSRSSPTKKTKRTAVSSPKKRRSSLGTITLSGLRENGTILFYSVGEKKVVAARPTDVIKYAGSGNRETYAVKSAKFTRFVTKADADLVKSWIQNE
jgi:hypothetical protein